MSGFLKTAPQMSTQPLTLSKKYTGFFLQSTTDSLPSYSPLTNFTCIWLVGFRPLSLQGMSGQGRPTKKISTSTEQKASLYDLPHPLWDKGRGLPLVPTGSQARRLSAPTLLDGSPPAFLSPAGYRRQAGEKVLPQILTLFSKIQTYICLDLWKRCYRIEIAP